MFAGCSGEEEVPVKIRGFTPISGDYHTEVFIRGSGFPEDVSDVQIFFGTEPAPNVLSSSPSELVVTVPYGATTGHIRVLIKGKEIPSRGVFTVTGGTWERIGGFQGSNQFISQTSASFVIQQRFYIHTSFFGADIHTFNATLQSYHAVDRTSATHTAIRPEFMIYGGKGFSDTVKGYIITTDALWQYNPLTDSWTEKQLPSTFPETGQIKAAFYLENTGLAYIIPEDGSTWTYNPATDNWAALPDLNMSHRIEGVTFTSSEAFIMVYDIIWFGSRLMRFDGTQWEVLGEYYNPTTFMFTLDGDIYAGSTSVGLTPLLWKFNIDRGEWVIKLAPPFTRGGVNYFSMGGVGYVGLGAHMLVGVSYNDFYEYRPD